MPLVVDGRYHAVSCMFAFGVIKLIYLVWADYYKL
jgi:hypothetical protein